MRIQDQLAAALYSDDPAAGLGVAVRRLVARGYDRDDLYRELGTLREALEHAGRERDEDTVLDVMDFLTGWCSPHMKL